MHRKIYIKTLTFALLATWPTAAAFHAAFFAACESSHHGPQARAPSDTRHAGHDHSSQSQSKERPQQLINDCKQPQRIMKKDLNKSGKFSVKDRKYTHKNS